MIVDTDVGSPVSMGVSIQIQWCVLVCIRTVPWVGFGVAIPTARTRCCDFTHAGYLHYPPLHTATAHTAHHTLYRAHTHWRTTHTPHTLPHTTTPFTHYDCGAALRCTLRRVVEAALRTDHGWRNCGADSFIR